jgi:hypothetical protein
MRRFAPILLGMLLLAGEFCAVLHVYGHDSLAPHADCVVCLKYSSWHDAVASSIALLVPHRAVAPLAVADTGRAGVTFCSNYHSRAPPTAL